MHYAHTVIYVVAAQSSLDWGDKVIGLNHPAHSTHPPTQTLN